MEKHGLLTRKKRKLFKNKKKYLILSKNKIYIYIKNIYYNYKFNLMLKNINKYILICREGLLTNGILNSISNPKITVLIPIYNSQKTIRTAVRSVQNQKMPEIEIILIDDASTDNSQLLIKELQNEDSRIKSIRNKRNRGALYSKSIGVFNANGEYLILLDSDDLFVNENLFDICYNEAKNNLIDIIEFSGFDCKTTTFKINYTKPIIPTIPLYLKYKENNQVVKQPQLFNFMYKKKGFLKYTLIDGYLCGKCIKTSIYIKSLKIITENIYNINLNYGDDRLINLVLLKIANSFKFIKIYGFIYNYNPYSITKSNKRFKKCSDELIHLMFIYNFTKTKNETDTEIVVYEILHRWFWIIRPGLNKNNKYYLNNLIKLILNEKYISEQSRNKIINILNLKKIKFL